MNLQTTVPSKAGWEGTHQIGKPEDLPNTNQLFTAFG
jgi:hypothetical protein